MARDRIWPWAATAIAAVLATATPSVAWVTWGQGSWRDANNTLEWYYNPLNEPLAVQGGPHNAAGVPNAVRQGAATWTEDRDNAFMDDLKGVVPEADRTRDVCGVDTDGDGFVDDANEDGLNMVGWAALKGRTPDDPDPLALTWLYRTLAGLEMDICINSRKLWQPGPALATDRAHQYDLETVILHEFGHAIGLDHSDEMATSRLGRPADEYAKTVMSNYPLPEGTNVRDLFCDDQSGADFLYPPSPPKHPPEPGATEPGRNPFEVYFGSCDFGDAPDPFPTLGLYPSLEGPFSPPLSVPPIDFDPLAPNVRNQITGGGDLGDPVILAPNLPGARHKDCSMEWLGPIPSDLPSKRRPIPASFRVRCRSTLPPVAPSVSFEPESRQKDVDELDDGVSVVQTAIDRFTVKVFVDTSGLGPARYVAANPDQRLYLSGWEDWNCDGDWDDPGEQPMFWAGTPTDDVAFSPTFVPPGVPMGTGRLLTFDVTAPADFELPCAERFRLDYAENAGENPRPWTKRDKTSRALIGPIPQAPRGTRGTLKYGEVEDYTFGDHYLCYTARDRAPPRLPVVNLFDQFFGASYRVKPVGFFCTPANKNRRPVIDPVTHLKGYRIAKLAGEHSQPLVDVHNQFGTLRLHAIKERLLFVPTAKKLDGPAPSPDPNQPGFEHYKCYKATTGETLPGDIIVEVSDQFGSGKYTLQRPRLLCNPSEKRTVGGPVEPINNPLRHLVCYGIKPISPIEPPRVVHANNQFGEETLRMGSEKLLCAPSLKVVVP